MVKQKDKQCKRDCIYYDNSILYFPCRKCIRLNIEKNDYYEVR